MKKVTKAKGGKKGGSNIESAKRETWRLVDGVEAEIISLTAFIR